MPGRRLPHCPTGSISDMTGGSMPACGLAMARPPSNSPGSRPVPASGVFASLDATPTGTGSVNLESLSRDIDTGKLAELCGASGEVSPENHRENTRQALTCDPDVLTGLLLRASNRGRRAYPWNGRHIALGVESVHGALDLLGPGTGCSPANPIAPAACPVAVAFRRDQPYSTSSSIPVEDP